MSYRVRVLARATNDLHEIVSYIAEAHHRTEPLVCSNGSMIQCLGWRVIRF